MTTTIVAPQARSASSSAFPKWQFFAVLLLFFAVFFGSLFSPGLQDDADSTHAEAAREMLLTHDFVTLKINGNRYLEKAPVMYWAVALSYSIFGVNEFAAHLPLAMSMLLLLLLAARWGERAFGHRAAIYAGMFFATTAGCYLFTRILIPESILSFFIAASFYFFATALEEGEMKGGKAWRWYAGYAGLALAVLTKGLLALAVVGMAAAAYAAISGEWRRWREFRLLTGPLLFLAIAAPWHILAGLRNPHFFWFYFVNEHFLRFLGKRIPKDYNKQKNSLYWSLHLVWLFPWSLYLPVALRQPIRKWRARRKNPAPQPRPPLTFRSRTELLCLAWAGVTLLFFSFSTNQEYYTFPAYFPMLLLIAARLSSEERASEGRADEERSSEEKKSSQEKSSEERSVREKSTAAVRGPRRWLVACPGVLAAICLASAAVLVWGLWTSRHIPFVPDIGTVLAKPNLQSDTLSMGHFLDLTGESFAALRFPAILATIVLLIGPTLAFLWRRKGRQLAATWATAITMSLFLIAAHLALIRFDPFLGSRLMARQIAPQLRPQDRFMIYGDEAYGSSLLFYLRRPIELIDGRTTSMWWGSTYPDAPHIFLDDYDLLQAWNSPQRVFLFVPEYQRARVRALLPGPLRVVSEASGKVIFTNHAQ